MQEKILRCPDYAAKRLQHPIHLVMVSGAGGILPGKYNSPGAQFVPFVHEPLGGVPLHPPVNLFFSDPDGRAIHARYRGGDLEDWRNLF